MAQRDNVFHYWGPLLMESLFDKMLDLHNDLREHDGLNRITKEAFLGSSHNHMNHLEPYDWMETDKP